MRSISLVARAASFACVLAILTGPVQAQTPIDDPPTAVAGLDQVIHAGEVVNLDGSDSFDDTSATANLLFSWSFVALPAGSSTVLSGDDTAAPSFVADLPGVYRVDLVVTDEIGQSSPPDVVEVSSLNMAPTADAGLDQSVIVNTPVFLDGLASSDPDLDPLTYAWAITSQPAGSAAVLLSAATATPSIVPDLEGEYVIGLVVNDGFGDSAPSSVGLMATSGADVAANEVRKAFIYARGLPKSRYDSKGHKRTTLGTLKAIHKDLLAGNVAVAASGLSRIIQRFDGCSLRGASDPKGVGLPDAPDWIPDCGDQMPLYDLLAAAIAAIAAISP